MDNSEHARLCAREFDQCRHHLYYAASSIPLPDEDISKYKDSWLGHHQIMILDKTKEQKTILHMNFPKIADRLILLLDAAYLPDVVSV